MPSPHTKSRSSVRPPVDALNRLAATLGIPTLTNLGYENLPTVSATPPRGPRAANSPKGSARSTSPSAARPEHANALLKVAFKALRRVVSLGLKAITPIARAALVLPQLEHGCTA
ncbi:hypothetical protein [Streptomyces sp. bgisy031]|uniref:hypothetical protein n=1 Tax=Streptomyces sp. bgisy031 TaxID=3413772 RepID=UPI003D74B3C7